MDDTTDPIPPEATSSAGKYVSDHAADFSISAHADHRSVPSLTSAIALFEGTRRNAHLSATQADYGLHEKRWDRSLHHRSTTGPVARRKPEKGRQQ